jgi:hypothetical protein
VCVCVCLACLPLVCVSCFLAFGVCVLLACLWCVCLASLPLVCVSVEIKAAWNHSSQDLGPNQIALESGGCNLLR